MASAGFAFTSGQAETMCKAHPPSVAARATSSLAFEAACNPAKLKDRLQHPRLNFGDLPESALPGRAALPRRPAPGRPRVKALSLPVWEEGAEAEEWEHEAARPAEAEDTPWSCPACTFLNCGLLSTCEMCQAEKGASPPRDLPESAEPAPASSGGWPMLTSLPGGEWPLLEEEADSWVDCDASSVASSWLDVDCAEACLVDDDAGALIVSAAGAPGATAPPATTWATRAGAAAEQGAAARVPRARAAMPPLARRAPAARPARQEWHSQGEEEEDPDLLDLEDRRLHPRTTRGATHRMRTQRRYG